MKDNLLVFIMAGGTGTRLFPLTRDRAKPSVPFGGSYIILDFVLNNFVNSGFRKMYILTQYKSFNLLKHLNSAWGFLPRYLDEFVYRFYRRSKETVLLGFALQRALGGEPLPYH